MTSFNLVASPLTLPIILTGLAGTIFPWVLAGVGVRVFATDIRPFQHQGLKVLVDDITQPDVSLYTGVDLIYSLRPPSELVPYMERLAREVEATLIVKSLASEYLGGQLSRRGNTTFFLWSHL